MELAAFALREVVEAALHPSSVAASVENAKDVFLRSEN
jgi:hypothetical protein